MLLTVNSCVRLDVIKIKNADNPDTQNDETVMVETKRKFEDLSIEKSTKKMKLKHVVEMTDRDDEMENLILQLRSGNIPNSRAFLKRLKRVIGGESFNNLKSFVTNNQAAVDDFNTEYSWINEQSRIIRSSWHQGDPEVFLFAGKQCCAISLAFIVRSLTIPPSEWKSTIVDQVMIEGNELYGTILVLAEHEGIRIAGSGYLFVQNFDVIKNELRMFNLNFTLSYDEDPLIFGNLMDSMNEEGSGSERLSKALVKLFENHSAGILIAMNMCFAVIYSCGKFYFCNSHNCGPNGDPNEVNDGRACVIECDTIQKLCEICKKATGSGNDCYTLDFIDVRRSDSTMSEE